MNCIQAAFSGGGGGGGGLWSQAYNDSWTSSQTIDTGTVEFKKYISVWIAISGFSNAAYKWEALFNNDSTGGIYNSREINNLNQATRVAQNDLNIYPVGGTTTTSANALLRIDIINKNNMAKVGISQGLSYTEGEDGGHFSRGLVYFTWDNNDLLTQIEIDPDTFGAGETFSLGEITVMHTDG